MNYADLAATDHMDTGLWIKSCFFFIVPFCTSTYGQIVAITKAATPPPPAVSQSVELPENGLA